MRYLGGKVRIAKDIIRVMLECDTAAPSEWYIEPFVGAFNVIDKVPSSYRRWGNDKNRYVISLFRALRQGWIPPSNISEEHYNEVKNNPENYDPHYVAFLGFAGGFCSSFFRGFSRNAGGTNYFAQSKNVLLKQAKLLRDVRMTCYDYRKLIIPVNSLIYCDPPYESTRQDYNVGTFDTEEFWEWCRNLSHKECKVFISSYEAPDDFICIWQKERRNLAGEFNRNNVVEKLYVWKRGIL